ncbi:MAG: 4Fe-4S binding protein [Clostridia bacterium]|nr:4Fe-4S binding protein [Clostridia bacterium]
MSVNLAAATKSASYIDCDVEEPNGRIFLQPKGCEETPVFTALPEFDESKCIGCRKCVEFCRFNALMFIGNKPAVFSEVCHACGGCTLVCSEGAVAETKKQIGTVEQGRCGNINVVTGILNIGEASGVAVIRKALDIGLQANGDAIIDCPPGSGCSVIESVSASDCCIIVAEPTAFGLHNFKMAYRLAKLLDKSCYAIINKEDVPYPPLDNFCAENGVKILARIPFDPEAALLLANGKLLYGSNAHYTNLFRNILCEVKP